MRQLSLQLTAALLAVLVQSTSASNAFCTSSGGACVDVNSCQGDSGVTVSNLCPDSGDNIKCCFYVTQDDDEKCVAKFGDQALGCVSTSYCTSQDGSSKAGFCPGTDDIQCCVLPASKAHSTFTLPTGPPKSSPTPPGPKPTVGSTHHASVPTYTMSPGTAAPPTDTTSSVVSGAPSSYSNSSGLSTTATLSSPSAAATTTSSAAATSTGGAWALAQSVRESWLVAPAVLAGFAGLFL